VVAPGDPDWDSARSAWNLAVDQRPALVVQVADVRDVQEVLLFAGRHGLRVAPQGTGHQAASLRDLSGVILLRTDQLREIRVDVDALTIRVGAGVLWGDVGWALTPHGLTARAGSSHDVGVVGYTLGGGYSWLTRRYGLAVSSVTAAELVTGDGTFHRVDADTEPELFWAVRGAGATFGVVTALEFGVLPFDQIYGGAVVFPIARAPEVLRRWGNGQRMSTMRRRPRSGCYGCLRCPTSPISCGESTSRWWTGPSRRRKQRRRDCWLRSARSDRLSTRSG